MKAITLGSFSDEKISVSIAVFVIMQPQLAVCLLQFGHKLLQYHICITMTVVKNGQLE